MKQSEKPQNAGTVLKKIRTNSSVNLIIILILMIVAIYIASPAFRSWSNMISVARLFAPIAIAGFGVCLVIITGGIDLSMGSIYGLAGVVSALFMSKMEFNPFLSVLLGLLVSLLFGLFNGLCIVKINLPPFIATLGTMSIARGLCYILTQGYPVSGVAQRFLFLGQGNILAVPVPIWCMVAIAIIMSVFLNKTVVGRRLYALGGNIEATRMSGVNTDKITVLVYTLCSLLSGFAGIITTSKLGIGQPTSGMGFEMDAIAAVAIGGASLSGGSGTVSGTIIGAAIMGILRNALVLLSVDSYYQQFIIGFVILIAVSADQISKMRE